MSVTEEGEVKGGPVVGTLGLGMGLGGMAQAPIRQVQVVLLRHAHSLGQAAGKHERKTSPHLVDAALSPLGLEQAKELRAFVGEQPLPDVLVVVSPLTRALQTAVIAFDGLVPRDKFIVTPEVAEVDSSHHHSIPENRGRPLHEVTADERVGLGAVREMDLSRVQAHGWPESHNASGVETRRSHAKGGRVARHARRPGETWFWLATLPADRIVVVSHCNWILRAVNDRDAPGATRNLLSYVDNATPLSVTLTSLPNGSVDWSLSDQVHGWFLRG